MCARLAPEIRASRGAYALLISPILFCARTHASESNTCTHVMVGDRKADQDAIEDVAVLATPRIRAPTQREWDSSRSSTGYPVCVPGDGCVCRACLASDLGPGWHGAAAT